MKMTADEIKKLIEVEKKIFWETETKGKKVEDVLDFAVQKSYQDLQLRTIPGHGNVPNLKNHICEDVKESFESYFMKKAPETKEKFIEKHEELCDVFMKSMNHKLSEFGVKNVNYGKAQKIVNMTFKYLYCSDNPDFGKEYFKFCQLPLDQYSLEWVRRISKELKLEKGHIDKDSWGKIQYDQDIDRKQYSYKKYRDCLYEYVEMKKLEWSLLELDIVIWPMIKKIISVENFIKSFDGKLIRNEDAAKYEIQELNNTLNSKLQEIQDIILSFINK